MKNTGYMVDFNFKDGKAQSIKIFDNKKEAEDFAKEHNGKVVGYTRIW